MSTHIHKLLDAALDTVQEIQAQNTELRELLKDARDSVEHEMSALLPHEGYHRYDEHIAALRALLQRIDAALAAEEGENVT